MGASCQFAIGLPSEYRQHSTRRLPSRQGPRDSSFASTEIGEYPGQAPGKLFEEIWVKSSLVSIDLAYLVCYHQY